jgi:hypothetical protein
MSLTLIFVGARAQGDRLHVLFVVFLETSGFCFADRLLLYGDKMPLLVVGSSHLNGPISHLTVDVLCDRFPKIVDVLKRKMLQSSSRPTQILTVEMTILQPNRLQTKQPKLQ